MSCECLPLGSEYGGRFADLAFLLNSAGGPQAWNKMRERQLAFYQGFDQDLPSKRKRSEEGDLEAEIEGDSENETEKYALQDESAKDDGNEEEGRELVSSGLSL